MSLDHFNKSKSQNINDIKTDSHIVTIPINYGRADISEEEINIINVSLSGIILYTHFKNFLYHSSNIERSTIYSISSKIILFDPSIFDPLIHLLVIASLLSLLHPSIHPLLHYSFIASSIYPSIASSIYPSIASLFIHCCPFIDSSICPSIMSSTYPSIALSICPSIMSFIYPSIASSTYPSIASSICPSIMSFIYPSIDSLCFIHQSIHCFTIHPLLHPSIHLSIHCFIHLSIYPSIASSIYPSIDSSISPSQSGGAG